jgi:oligopeptide transport system permease protein
MAQYQAHIPAEMFEFVNRDTQIHDEKFKTKPRGYFADAFLRFKKNKSSVVAAFIIGFLILFSIFAPIISPYTVYDKDNVYQNFPPFIESIADKNIGLFNGSREFRSLNETGVAKYLAIGVETGYNPILGEVRQYEVEERYRGQPIIKTYYAATINCYYMIGAEFKTISYDEFEKIQQFQNETGIQVLLPYINDTKSDTSADAWYKVDEKNAIIYDENGNFVPNYSTDASKAGPIEYNSKRIAGDDGSYIYSWAKSGSLHVRICYYNYYQYTNGRTPTHIMGTDEYGRDLFDAIGTGARFSLVFAVIVSAINLTIGAIYGAIQGYYGGVVDLAMDRVTDILSGVPSIVVMTLFKLHLAQKIGVLPSILFAFVLTGWIGMAALTRKQFYRFKSQEYVMAARTLGASDRRLMFKHIFPNSLGTMVTSCALVIPGVISSETSLTYLGIINLSTVVGTSVGELMECGQRAMSSAPHAMLFPALYISLLLISFNLFGNGLRDAFNPSTRGAED